MAEMVKTEHSCKVIVGSPFYDILSNQVYRNLFNYENVQELQKKESTKQNQIAQQQKLTLFILNIGYLNKVNIGDIIPKDLSTVTCSVIESKEEKVTSRKRKNKK